MLSTPLLSGLVVADRATEAGDGGPGAWWPIFPGLWLLVLAAIITTVVVSRRRNARRAGSRAGEARLAERYAAGEIGDQEYRDRRAVLREQAR